MSDEKPKTRPERIDACVAKVAPKSFAYFQTHGRWPSPTSFAEDGTAIPPAASVAARRTRFLDEGLSDSDATSAAQRADDQHRRCPYVIKTLSENRRRLIVSDDDGEVAVSVVGKTIEEAIAALETKLS